MTRPLYYDDPYRRKACARVTGSSQDGERLLVQLDQTIFYPEGGGQPGDTGWIGPVRVHTTRKTGETIIHEVEDRIEGDVEMRLDWEARIHYMRHHTAQHLITALAGKKMGWETLSFHLTRSHGTLDLAGGNLDDERLAELEDIVNEAIRSMRPVTARFVERAEYERMAVRSRRLPADLPDRIRIVTIEGIDDNTCGGLHVANLGELQTLRMTRAERIKGGAFRVIYRCGEALLERIRENGCLLDDIRDRLGCGRNDFLDALDALSTRAREEGRGRRRVAEFLARILAGDPVLPRLFIPGLDPSMLAGATEALAARHPDSTVLIATETDGDIHFAIQRGSASDVPASDLLQSILNATGGRGGGRDDRCRGKAPAAARDALLAIIQK